MLVNNCSYQQLCWKLLVSVYLILMNVCEQDTTYLCEMAVYTSESYSIVILIVSSYCLTFIK